MTKASSCTTISADDKATKDDKKATNDASALSFSALDDDDGELEDLLNAAEAEGAPHPTPDNRGFITRSHSAWEPRFLLPFFWVPLLSYRLPNWPVIMGGTEIALLSQATMDIMLPRPGLEEPSSGQSHNMLAVLLFLAR